MPKAVGTLEGCEGRHELKTNVVRMIQSEVPAVEQVEVKRSRGEEGGGQLRICYYVRCVYGVAPGNACRKRSDRREEQGQPAQVITASEETVAGALEAVMSRVKRELRDVRSDQTGTRSGEAEQFDC